jgi:hypothetical protein
LIDRLNVFNDNCGSSVVLVACGNKGENVHVRVCVWVMTWLKSTLAWGAGLQLIQTVQ